MITLPVAKLKRTSTVPGWAEAILQSTSEAYLLVDTDGAITGWSPGAVRLFEYASSEILGRSVTALFPEECRADRARLLEAGARGLALENLTTVGVSRSSAQFHVAINITPLVSSAGAHAGASICVRDITKQKQDEVRLEYFEAIVRHSNDAIISKTLDGIVTSWNPGAERLFGYSAQEMVGKLLSTIVPEDFRAQEEEIVERLTRGESIDHIETVRVRKDGLRVDISATISPIITELGQVVGASNIARDITDKKLQAAIISDMAYRDPLTNLANRRLLLDRLKLAMLSENRARRHAALLYLDLDNFKTVNDSAGHDVGDLLLVSVARRIESVVREVDTVSRMGGDEFAIFLDGLNENRQIASLQAQVVAAKILEVLRQVHAVRGNTYDCPPSIGIALFFGAGASVEQVIKCADDAMYRAKTDGKNRILLVDAH